MRIVFEFGFVRASPLSKEGMIQALMIPDILIKNLPAAAAMKIHSREKHPQSDLSSPALSRSISSVLFQLKRDISPCTTTANRSATLPTRLVDCFDAGDNIVLANYDNI